MTMLWKILVLALVGYAIHLHHKLLYLADAAYKLAHETAFSTVRDSTRSLHDTVWGGEAITSMNMAMYGIIVLVALALVGDLIRLIREPIPAPPPPAPPPAGPPPADALEQTPPPAV